MHAAHQKAFHISTGSMIEAKLSGIDTVDQSVTLLAIDIARQQAPVQNDGQCNHDYACRGYGEQLQQFADRQERPARYRM